MSRQIRAPITVIFDKWKLQKGHNTAILMKNGQNILARVDQFRSRMVPEDTEMEEELEIDEQEEEERTGESCYENEQTLDEKTKNPTCWKRKMNFD